MNVNNDIKIESVFYFKIEHILSMHSPNHIIFNVEMSQSHNTTKESMTSQ